MHHKEAQTLSGAATEVGRKEGGGGVCVVGYANGPHSGDLFIQ